MNAVADTGLQLRSLITKGGELQVSLAKVPVPEPKDDEVVVRGDLQGRELIAFWRREGRVLAAMNVNVWDVVEDVQALDTTQQGQRLA